MRIGLYGGSFDPIHRGHLLVAQAALEEFQLDRLIFIPAAQSPFKPGSTPSSPLIRMRLLRMALAGQTRCAVDDLEVRRGGISYTIETVRNFQSRFPEAKFYWLIGEDHVATLPQWREAESLAERVDFLVIPRPGIQPTRLPESYRLHTLKGWPLKVSASEIRERLQKGLPISHLVPSHVASVLENERIYLKT